MTGISPNQRPMRGRDWTRKGGRSWKRFDSTGTAHSFAPLARRLEMGGLRNGGTNDWRAAMRISTMIRVDPTVKPHDRLLNRMADYARRIEASGFPGIWVGDSLGRGRPTLDPLIQLSVHAALPSSATSTGLARLCQLLLARERRAASGSFGS